MPLILDHCTGSTSITDPRVSTNSSSTASPSNSTFNATSSPPRMDAFTAFVLARSTMFLSMAPDATSERKMSDHCPWSLHASHRCRRDERV